jgi:membrane protease YdiL (CAAX protease family)
MPESAIVGGAVAAGIVVSVLWGRSLWYLDERSEAFRRGVFFVMGFSRRKLGEVRALLLSGIYYSLGLLAALLLALVFGLKASSLVSFSAAQVGITVLGIVGEISLANLLIDFSCLVTRQGPERFAEIVEIPWMKGLQQLPAAVVPFAAALGGVVEEFVFRGVLLCILTERLAVGVFAAVAITTVLFCLQQLMQVRTVFQAMVMTCSCVAISVVGGLLVALTGSVIPALLAHASFVIFFMTPPTEPVGRPQRAPAAVNR